MVTFAVCDDEPAVRDHISDKLLSCYPGECKICKYEDGESLLADSREQIFDALFLDIDMPNIDGLTLAQEIRETNEYVKIIFISNMDNMVYSSLKYVPFRFIRKTHLDEELPEAAAALRDSIAKSNATVFFNTKDGSECVPVKSIVYTEVLSHVMTVHLLDRKIKINKSMEDLENELRSYGFLRTHKSYLVNYIHVKLILRNKIYTDTDDSIPLSRNYMKDVRARLQQLSRNKSVGDDKK